MLAPCAQQKFRERLRMTKLAPRVQPSSSYSNFTVVRWLGILRAQFDLGTVWSYGNYGIFATTTWVGQWAIKVHTSERCRSETLVHTQVNKYVYFKLYLFTHKWGSETSIAGFANRASQLVCHLFLHSHFRILVSVPLYLVPSVDHLEDKQSPLKGLISILNQEGSTGTILLDKKTIRVE